MKISSIVTYSIFSLVLIKCILAAPYSPDNIPDQLDDLDPLELAALDSIDHDAYTEYTRAKRSGSPDFFSAIKHKISAGIHSKLKQIGQASAGFSGGHKEQGYHYDPPHHDDGKNFDWWTLKKQILNTLFQAAKAIKGGVIAIKGQLIKGGGQLISAKGKLISAKGEAISGLGRHIATSAQLIPHKGHTGHSAPAVVYPVHKPQIHDHGYLTGPSAPAPSFGPPEHYGAPSVASSPSGLSGHYGAPSSTAVTHPGSEYGAPSAPSSHYTTGGFGSASSTGFGQYLPSKQPSKFTSAYEGIMTDGKPPSEVNLNLHHTGTLTLVAPDPKPNGYDPRQNDHYVPSPSDNPKIPPYTHIPLKDNIPSGILQSILAGNTHSDTPLNSYDPPPTGDFSADANLTPPVDQTDTFSQYSQPQYDQKHENNDLTEDTSVFETANPEGPEPRPNDILSLWGRNQDTAIARLETAQSQLNQQIQALVDQPEPSNHLKRSPMVFADPMTYPMHNPAYQLYKQMGAKNSPSATHGKRTTKRTKRLRSKRKPVVKTYIYTASDRKSA